MKPDWSRRALWTGLILSLTAFALHSTNTVSMTGLNPLLIAGCATTGANYAKPSAPPPGVSTRAVHLVRKGKLAILEKGAPIYVVDAQGKHGPVLVYGANYRRQLFYASGPNGTLIDYPFDTIQKIQVIDEGNTAKGAGWGALYGGLTMGLIPLVVDGGRSAALLPFCAATGAGLGAISGTVGGAIKDIDRYYNVNVGSDHYRFRIPQEELVPRVNPTPTDPVEEAAPEATVDSPAETTEDKPATPTDEESGTTVKDWIDKKKTDNSSDDESEE